VRRQRWISKLKGRRKKRKEGGRRLLSAVQLFSFEFHLEN
jgi:hypothetical protein